MHRRRKTDSYRMLKQKVFWQTALMMVAAFAAVWGFYLFVWRGHFADFIVGILQRLMGLNYAGALEVYHLTFRRNFDALMLVAIGACFFLIFRFFLNWFMKYFHEIDRGVSLLLDRGDTEIHMSAELKPMEQKLNQVHHTLEQQFLDIREAEQKKDELVMYLAHDIRTPLTSVIGYLNLLIEMPDLSDAQRQKFVQVTLEKAERLETLVNEFFDITRYNRTQIELSKENIDLYYLLVQLKEEAYPSLSRKGMTLRIDAEEDCMAYGNADKLARVFHNLLKNAVAYGDRGSEITIRVRETKEETILFISNHGATISQVEQERIFDKFYRMDAARQSDSGGAGLGLAIAKELVLMHGGDIRVESCDGVTTFQVTLPKSLGKHL